MGTPANNLAKAALQQQVQQVLSTMVRAQEEGNWELFAQCFKQNNETINIGTDLDEYWIGWTAFQKTMSDLFKLKKGHQIHVKNTRISISDNGQVAWYAQMTDTCLETKGEPVRIEGFRHTGVMILDGHQWYIVQSHISVPVLEPLGFSEPTDIDLLMQI